jgi:hypothetical protein
VGYLSVLLPVAVHAAVRFDSLYAADSLATHAELSQQYKAFVDTAGLGLAVCLGLLAAGFGVWRNSLAQGLAALAAGAAVTIAALSVVPWVRFP